ncbi:MAG: hypothetical protein WA005_18290 [Candidatus Binataceae bacterium]
MRSTTLIAMTFLALMMLAPATHAQTNEGSPAGGSSHRGAMMKAMVEACANKSAGDSCSYPGRDGQTEKGTCKATRRGKLICRHPRKTGGPTGSEMPPGANPER